MSRKVSRTFVATIMLGSVFQFGSCLGGDGFVGRAIQSAISYAALEFVLDNDTVVDLFESGN